MTINFIKMLCGAGPDYQNMKILRNRQGLSKLIMINWFY